MDLIDLVFDYDYFLQNNKQEEALGWNNALANYKDNYISLCVPPSTEFMTDSKLMYFVHEGGRKECKLNEWLRSYSKESLENVLEQYLLGNANRGSLLVKSLNGLAKNRPSDLESLLCITENYIGIWIQGLVIDALASNLMHELAEKSIHCIGKDIERYSDKIGVIKSAATILSNSKLHVDSTIFLSIEAFLGQDTKDSKMAITLAYASKNHSYAPSFENLTYFEKLLSSKSNSEVAVLAISKTLEVILNDPYKGPEFDKVDQKIRVLLSHIDKLPLSLVNSLFDSYKVNQSYFTGLIVDMLAEGKYFLRIY